MENDERKNDERRKKKIDKILDCFDSYGIILIDKKSIGKVGLEEVEVAEDYVSDLFEEDFTKKEIDELLQFFKRVNWLLIDADGIGYISLDECKVNRDLIYDSVKF